MIAIKRNPSIFWAAAVTLIAAAVLASGGYRIATGYWPLQGKDYREQPGASLQEARQVAPFQILTPEYLPPGHRLGPVAVLTLPPKGPGQPHGGVNGVSISYANDQGLSFVIEQEIGEVSGDYAVGNAEKVGAVNLRGTNADLWLGHNIKGRQQYALVWKEPTNAAVVHMVSYLSREETLRVAESLQ